MEISSAASSVRNTPPVQPQTPPVRTKEVENDGDKDDSATKLAAATQAAQRPTVNTSGQVVGSIVNTQA